MNCYRISIIINYKTNYNINEGYCTYDKALEIIDMFGENSNSDMIGKTDFIMIYNAEKEIHTENASFLMGSCLIMKNYYGLKCMNEEEIEQAIAEFQSRLTRINMGPFCFSCCELG